MATAKGAIALTNQQKMEVLTGYGFSEEQLLVIQKTVAENASFTELALFLHQCARTGLDPLSRQIHFVKYGQGPKARISIITGIDGYRLVADRTGRYAGNDDYTYNGGLSMDQHIAKFGNEVPRTATATVYKLVGDKAVAFTASASWSSYYPGGKAGSMWVKMPHLMLGKCAEALAMRKAFPAELSGVYTREEMDQAWDYAKKPELAKKILEKSRHVAETQSTNGPPKAVADQVAESLDEPDEELTDEIAREAEEDVQEDAEEPTAPAVDTEADKDERAFQRLVKALQAHGLEPDGMDRFALAVVGIENIGEATPDQVQKMTRVGRMMNTLGVKDWPTFIEFALEFGMALSGRVTISTAIADFQDYLARAIDA